MDSTWWGVKLPGLRGTDAPATYEAFDPATLPPVPDVLGDGLHWLRLLPTGHDPVAAGTLEWEPFARAGIDAPPELLALLGDPALQQHVNSVTAACLDLAAFDRGDDGWLILFLRDQQDVLLWFVQLDADGAHRVVACGGEAMDDWYEAEQPPLSDAGPAESELSVCAASVREFVFRFAVENALWASLHAKPPRPLSALERAYAEHYA